MLPVEKRKDHLTLEEVRGLFERWRREKRRRDPIPPALWEAAVALTRKHSMNEISRRLRLSYNELKSRAVNPPVGPAPKPPAFIELDGILKNADCTIAMEKPTGERMRIKGSCAVMELVREFFA